MPGAVMAQLWLDSVPTRVPNVLLIPISLSLSSPSSPPPPPPCWNKGRQKPCLTKSATCPPS
ncbi:hypothetical protein AAG906_018495 [Vitis piasezkii]|uniref:Uncharacterized protein n=1 Tax=Vitis vinifera TaxID=29760 RepID=F6HBI3_VITVI